MRYYLEVVDDNGELKERVDVRSVETLMLYTGRFEQYEEEERQQQKEQQSQEDLENAKRVAEMAQGNPVWTEERDD